MPSGSVYETKAADFLKQKGYKVIQRNFRTGAGEIDIIAQDKDFVAFVEVKARHLDPMISGLEAVTFKKRARIKKAALAYTQTLPETNFRFDVLEVIYGKDWLEYNLIKDAFGMDD